jgi:hypothetical protein
MDETRSLAVDQERRKIGHKLFSSKFFEEDEPWISPELRRKIGSPKLIYNDLSKKWIYIIEGMIETEYE